jgi:hypothetical protein
MWMNGQSKFTGDGQSLEGGATGIWSKGELPSEKGEQGEVMMRQPRERRMKKKFKTQGLARFKKMIVK